MEVAGGDAGAEAGVAVLPAAEVGFGEVFGVDHGPLGLLDGSADGFGEGVPAGMRVRESAGGEEGCGGEDPLMEAHTIGLSVDW